MIVRGRHHQSGEVQDFYLEGGLVTAIAAPSRRNGVLGGEGHWVSPGLIDIQVNGYKGHDFCSGDATVDDVVSVAEELTTAGVTAFCPTVTTNSGPAITASLGAIARACKEIDLARERVLAIHLEGPYISPTDGPRGAHSPEHVRNPDWEEFTRFQEAADGRIGLITLAPELSGALDFIVKARKAGIVVAIGHHDATEEQINAAASLGAVLSTHLGNGSHNLLHRHNNYIWHQLANDALMASIIVDGHHLPPAVVKSFYRVKGRRRLILISDVNPAAGLQSGRFKLMDQEIEIMKDGSARLLGTPYLAGSTLRLCDAINNFIDFADAPFSDAIMMGTENPARLLGVGQACGHLHVGARANLTLFRPADDKHKVAFTIIGGSVCYEA